MFRYVVTIHEDGVAASVEQITSTGSVLPKITYPTIEELPDDVCEKVKQLKWVSETDQTFYEGVGTRVGHNIFWIC